MNREKVSAPSIALVLACCITAGVTAGLVWLVTGRAALAFVLAAVATFTPLLASFVSDRIWKRLPTETACVLWFTGLSGAGKTTIAEEVCRTLRHQGKKVEFLDGDAIRAIFPNTGFSREEREAHIRRVGFLASRLEQHGIIVVTAMISPYRESREFVRKLCADFVEVHIATPLAECERRDVKGLYAKARRGEIRNLTGVNDPYEEPLHPTLTIDTTKLSVRDATDRVLSVLETRNQRGRLVSEASPVSLAVQS